MDDVTGLILAGGRSARFGTDKAHYRLGGRAMIASVAVAVGAVADTLLVSVAEATGGFLPDGLAARVVTDRVRDAGPLAGLHAGLEAAATPWVLAVACDMPSVTAEALRRLLEARTPEVDAVVARSPDGRLHPLCACYHRRILAAVAARLDAGRFAMHGLLGDVTVRVVDLPDGPLRNVNTPADLP